MGHLSANAQPELTRSESGDEFLVVASEADVDCQVGEQVGHFGSVTKLGRRRFARARMDALGPVSFRTSGAGAPSTDGSVGVQVGVRWVVFRELSERFEHVPLIDRASQVRFRDIESDTSSDIHDVHVILHRAGTHPAHGSTPLPAEYCMTLVTMHDGRTLHHSDIGVRHAASVNTGVLVTGRIDIEVRDQLASYWERR